MMRIILKSKIHNATVTSCNLHYEGSITIPRSLMELADLVPGEQVHIYNVSNGQRFITYVIEGFEEGKIQINGAAARLCSPGDTIIIVSYAVVDDNTAREFKPKVVIVDKNNKPLAVKK